MHHAGTSTDIADNSAQSRSMNGSSYFDQYFRGEPCSR
jgi:hypothetical protein